MTLTATFLNGAAPDSTNLTSATFLNQPLGPPGPKRKIYVFVLSSNGGTTNFNGVTVNGVFKADYTHLLADIHGGIVYDVDVPNGSTGTIVVNVDIAAVRITLFSTHANITSMVGMTGYDTLAMGSGVGLATAWHPAGTVANPWTWTNATKVYQSPSGIPHSAAMRDGAAATVTRYHADSGQQRSLGLTVNGTDVPIINRSYAYGDVPVTLAAKDAPHQLYIGDSGV